MWRWMVGTLLLLGSLAVGAQESEEDWQAAVAAFEAQLDFRRGRIDLPEAGASLDIPEDFRFLGPADAESVLVDLWGNPPGTEALGLLVPAGVSLADPASWAVVVQYEEEGYVSDEDASDIDYDELLDDMQQSSEAENEARQSQGYGRVDLVGWAEPPHYEADSHKLYWAKELAFEDSPINTLNYNIRVLGRQGVLVLNAVAGMNQLGDIRGEMAEVLAFTNFEAGSRYEDFDPEYDKVAAYGVGALVAGKLAAKTGLLAKLGVLLLAFKKFGLIILVAVGGLLARLFGRSRKTEA